MPYRHVVGMPYTHAARNAVYIGMLWACRRNGRKHEIIYSYTFVAHLRLYIKTFIYEVGEPSSKFIRWASHPQ